ncbi:hypothetical protein ACJZ2D_016626 [Fusarium nematophilum]
MSAFVQPCSPPPGDFPLSSHLDAVATTPYLLIPPSGWISIASPMPQNSMIYQQIPSQTSVNSFSPVQEDLVFGSSYIASPSQPMEPKILGGNGLPQNILQTIKADNESNRRPRNRRQSKTSSAISEPRASGNTAESPRPSKQGRKPKKQTSGQKGSGQQERLDDSSLSIDRRQRRMLERNRIAATKCRLRKRDEASILASREKAMEDRNRSLSACFDSLTAEIYYLKTELLRHADCNCVLIQKYIAHEAQKSVNGLLACPSAFDVYDVSLSPNDGSSSSAGTADALNMHSLEADGIPPAGTKPFQRGSRASEVMEDVFGTSLEPFNTAPALPDLMVSAHPFSSVSLVGCGQGLYGNMGPQEHQADEIGWVPHWSFDDSVAAIS